MIETIKIPNRAPRQVLWEPKIGLPLIVLPESIGFAKDLKMPAFFINPSTLATIRCLRASSFLMAFCLSRSLLASDVALLSAFHLDILLEVRKLPHNRHDDSTMLNKKQKTFRLPDLIATN